MTNFLAMPERRPDNKGTNSKIYAIGAPALFELISYVDPKTFQSAWFWILLAVTWSVMSFRTLNVPYDMIISALKGDQGALADTEMLSGISARRNRRFFTNGGGLGTGIVFFILGVAGTFGLFYSYELAQGIFLFFLPVQIVWLMSIRLSFRIEKDDLAGEDLCKALLRRRFWNQVLGILVISIAMMVMIYNIATKTVYWM